MTYSIKIYNDHWAENPRESWDCMSPLITNWWRDFWDHSYWIDIVDFVSKKLNNKNMYKIAECIWYDKNYIISRIDKYCYYNSLWVIEDILSDIWYDIEMIEKVLDILKVKNYRRTSRWYSQWDCVDCIIIYTDEYIKEIWIKNKDIKDGMKSSAKLFDSRARWDVYSYTITKHNRLYDKDWKLSSITEDEVVDSCWWFYWDDWLDQIFNELPNEYWITEEMFESAKENIIYE